jgi:hypothetical protein
MDSNKEKLLRKGIDYDNLFNKWGYDKSVESIKEKF